MVVKNDKLFIAFEVTLFCAFLYSMNCFWFWSFRLPYFNLCALFLIFFNRRCLKITKENILVSVLFFVAQIYGHGADDDMFKLASAAIYSILVMVLLSLDLSLQKRAFTFIYNALAVILAFSLVAFFLVLLNVPLPNMGRIVHPEALFYWYDNYLILAYGCYGIRFNAVFCEPGHLGMIVAFLLFINGYNLKNRATVVLLLSLLFSLSLAGYVLAGIGYVLQQMKSNFKKTMGNVVKTVLLVSIAYIAIVNYNGGNNLLNTLIVERLAYDESEGTIAGDNRSSEGMKAYFETLNTDDILFGVDRITSEEVFERYVGSGYIPFIIANGIVGILVVFLFYFGVLLISDKRIRAEYLCLFLIYGLCFIQRCYPFWTSEVFPFIFANGCFLTRYNSFITNKQY